VFQRQSRVLNRNLNSLAQPSQRQGLRHPPSDKPSSRRIDVTTPSSTPRTRARTTIERTDRRWNKRNAPPRHRPRRHRVVASSRFTRRFVHPSHQGSFTRPPHARAGVDIPTSPSTRRSHERIDRAKKIKSIVTTPRRDPRRRRPANANVKSHAPPSPPREPRSPPREPRSRSRARARARARVVPRT